MTGIERLRELAELRVMENRESVTLRAELRSIADQIARELTCDKDAIENIRLIVGGVVDEMERHVSGVEGMEDSPVARWARELREALGGDVRDPADDVSMSAYDLLPEDERDAVAWVREHGGLDAVKTHWKRISYYADPVPRSYAEKRIAKLKRQIDENHAALRRRNQRIAELEAKVRVRERANDELNEELIAMLPRLMPEGMEWLVEAWPRFEDDSPVRLLDDFERYGEESGVSVVTMYSDGSFALNFRSYSKGERVNRPAPEVLDADGAEIRVGDTVWFADRSLEDYDPHIAESVNADPGLLRTETIKLKGCNYPFPASSFTHRAPVLAADGKPLREGETVWDTKGNGPYNIQKIENDGVIRIDGRGLDYFGSEFVHERPDSWERLEEDAKATACIYFGVSDRDCESCVHRKCSYEKARDLVRRARALAERGR